MRFIELSEKQREIFKFILSENMALICDGAVRSGKTTVMVAAFVIWAMENFNRTNFGICGKTVQSAERNVLRPLQESEDLPYTMTYKVSTRVLTVRCGNKVNWFYLFGGKDESSYMLIQGITLAGVLFDEVALMPKSFVEQALARAISFDRPKYFFNCNPESPNHYFYKEWIETERPGTKHIHFLLEDNPILTERMIERTKAMYSGVFYDRYILGKWVAAEGLVYPMFGEHCISETIPRDYEKYVISMDYGIQNPTSMGLWGLCGGIWYRVKEYYHSGRETNQQKTDQQYYDELVKLAGDLPIFRLIVDPSAASFIAIVEQKHEFKIWDADNAVIEGIQHVAQCLSDGTIKINSCCDRCIQEFGLYAWDEKAAEDKPLKVNDHCLTGDTLVDTLDGPRPIKDLVGESGFVWCANGGNAAIKPFHNVRMTQKEAEVFEVTLSDGRSVKATAEHPILTKRGWVQVKDLRSDDEIACIGGNGNEGRIQRGPKNSAF